MAVFVVQLRRQDNSQPWGFRLKGGIDQGLPLHVEHVQPKGRAQGAGVVLGDMILAIGGASTHNMTHQQVKNEMLRAGNELDLTVQRDASIAAQQPPPLSQPQAAYGGRSEDEPRVVIDEQPICKLGGPTFKQVKPKTYQVLEGQLQTEIEAPAAEAVVKPASIFDRKRNERSEYLKAQGCTIQKAYGE